MYRKIFLIVSLMILPGCFNNQCPRKHCKHACYRDIPIAQQPEVIKQTIDSNQASTEKSNDESTLEEVKW